jgi:tyrosine-protein kinase Etk/Wzc
MHEENTLNSLSQGKLTTNNEIQSLKKLIGILSSRKYLFVGTLITTLFLAFLYNKYTIPIYKVTAAILIEEDKKTAPTGNDQLLEGFGIMPGMKNFDNQIMVLGSRTLIGKTLDELNIDTEYFNKGLMNKKSLFPARPIDIIFSEGTMVPYDVDFGIKYIGDEKFRITTESKGSFSLDKNVSFGERIDIPGGSLIVERRDSGFLKSHGEKKLYFTVHSRRNLVESYIKKFKVNRASKQGSIVKISLEGTNKYQDLAFLTRLAEIFLNISLERKNNEAIRTIQFIDDQLTGISDSLVITENKLQQFRSRNRVMNISAQGQVIINQAVVLENEKARLGIEANYYQYLTQYLDKDSVGEGPVAPATMGISDPGLTKLVADLADQTSRLYSKSMGEKNPLQNQLTQKVRATKSSLHETLKGLTRANSMAMSEVQSQISSINNQASALPRTERQLLGIERKYKLNDELYTFLLEKRAVAQMQKASNVADNEMIDYPEYENKPVKPKKSLIFLLALVSGFGFPFLWIFLADVFNIRIKELDDVKKITSIPILGHIPHFMVKKTTIVLNDPASAVAESFRLLRSRMMFFTKDNKTPVILVTSSMPEEGKTFTAINLASAYSLMGIKTVLLGFDMRQPKIFNEFGKSNERGISTWLIGKDNLDDIIIKTDYENLDIIPSGPIPPNPAELTSLPKTGELIQQLKARYDCILIDTAPLGTVSDAFHLISLCDTCILIVRQNITIRDILENTIKDLKISNINNLCLVINDMHLEDRRYGYGIKYGNNYRETNSRKNNKSLLNIVHLQKN